MSTDEEHPVPIPVGPPTPDSRDTSASSVTNVFITGLPLDLDEYRLRALFATFGEIRSCKVMVDIDSGTSLGFGFVCYVDPLHAVKAIEAMHGKKLNASCPRAMTVSLARNEGTVSAIESERVYIRNVPVNMRDHEICAINVEALLFSVNME